MKEASLHIVDMYRSLHWSEIYIVNIGIAVLSIFILRTAFDRFRYRKLRKQIKKAAKCWCEKHYSVLADKDLSYAIKFLYKQLYVEVKPQYKALKYSGKKVYLSDSQPHHVIANVEKRLGISSECVRRGKNIERLEISLQGVRFV